MQTNPESAQRTPAPPVQEEGVNQPSARQQQVVLILVGLVGSGKSTFAEALQTYYPHFRRCNQDDLGDRRAVETLARSSLREGQSVCIDRTNIDAQQRLTWMRIAREFPGTLACVLEFDTPYDVCERRLMSRTSHPTITSPELGISVLQRFSSQYRPPGAWEGFDQMLTLRIDDQPSNGYSQTDVSNILTHLRQAPRISPSLWRPVDTQGGGGRGVHRGGYGNGYQRSYSRGRYAPRGYGQRGGYYPEGRDSQSSPQQHSWRSTHNDDR